MNIDFFMSNVIVATQYDIWMLLSQGLHIVVKFVQPLVLVLLPFIARCTGREVSIDQFHLTKIQLNHPPFIITYFMAGAALHAIGMNFGKYGYAAIAFFLC